MRDYLVGDKAPEQGGERKSGEMEIEKEKEGEEGKDEDFLKDYLKENAFPHFEIWGEDFTVEKRERERESERESKREQEKEMCDEWELHLSIQ